MCFALGFYLGEEKGGELPENKSPGAVEWFRNECLRRFEKGDGEKAKEAMGIAEVLEMILLSMDTPDLYKCQRISKHFLAVIRSPSRPAIQVKLRRKQARKQECNSHITPELQSLIGRHSKKAVIIKGRAFYFLLRDSSFRESWKPYPGPSLYLELINKNVHTDATIVVDCRRKYTPSDTKQPTCLLPLEDSRMDMLLFGAPMTERFGINIEFNEGINRWFLKVRGKVCLESDQPGYKREREPWVFHFGGIRSEHKHTLEFLGTHKAEGGMSCDDMPINGTLRDMLIWVEVYAMEATARYQAHEGERFEGNKDAATEMYGIPLE